MIRTYKLYKACLWIGLSTLPLAFALLALLLFRHAVLPDGPIEGLVVHSSPAAPPFWIAEILELSADRPLAMSALDLQQAQKKLLATHVFAAAKLRLQRPNLLDVMLVPRTPIAEIADFPRTGVDAEGWLFPLDPLYSCYKLPKVYLGKQCPEAPWGHCLASSTQQQLRSFLQRNDICFLDLSAVEAPSLGKRTCVLGLRNGDVLRCSPETASQQLMRYDRLSAQNVPRLIDLRLDHMLFIKTPPSQEGGKSS